jgi:hypothetical protein
VRWQRRAVELLPGSAEAAAALAAYEALAPPAVPEPSDTERARHLEEAAATGVDAGGAAASGAGCATRTGHADWGEVERELTRRGCARVGGLLAEGECQSLRGLWSEPAAFEHAIELEDERGNVAYRFFTRPLPSLIAEVRREVYARAAAIANRWNGLLGKAERFPADHEAFLDLCRRAGQTRTTPILLRYARGGFNAFHRDVFGDVVFPLQLAITLGPGSSDDGGGELLLRDERPGKERVTRVATRVGDGVLFCTRARLVQIGGLHGLQSVLHGVSPVCSEERYAAGIPFHDYR